MKKTIKKVKAALKPKKEKSEEKLVEKELPLGYDPELPSGKQREYR